jgi:cytochrome c
MKQIVTFILIGFFVAFSGQAAFAGDLATAKDVYELVLQGHAVLETLGEEGLAAFNDKKGEFVHKDTYAFVMECPIMVAHPFSTRLGQDLTKEYPFLFDMCKLADTKGSGWIEYGFRKPGEETPSRKISFLIKVEGTPWVVGAGIYNDDITLEELNATLD